MVASGHAVGRAPESARVEAVSTPEVESFDEWYRSIDASPRWDPFMQQALGLPLGRPVDRLPDRRPGWPRSSNAFGWPGDALVELGCGRGGYGMAVVRATGARLVGVDFSAVALAAAREQAAHLQLDDQVAFTAGDLTATGCPRARPTPSSCLDAVQFARPVPRRSPSAAAPATRRAAGADHLEAGGSPAILCSRNGSGTWTSPRTYGRQASSTSRRTFDPDWSTVERKVWEVAVRAHGGR